MSKSVDDYFGRATPSQMDQVVLEEEEHRPVPPPRHPIRVSMHHFHFSSRSNRHMIYDASAE